MTDLAFEAGGTRLDLDAYMTRCRTVAIQILKDGEVAVERHAMESTPQTQFPSYSIAKSMTATLAGAALHDGAIGSLDDPCHAYLARLRGSAYEGVTIRNLLRMCSGVGWSEEADGRSESGPLQRALKGPRPGAILDLARGLPAARPQGTAFNYSTADSCVLGAVVARATGRCLADYAAERLWQPAGMEADGSWWLECEGGLEWGAFGVWARLRDFGRFGQFVLENGPTAGGRSVLPSGWRDLAGQPDGAATAFGRLLPGSPFGYGYQWWALPHGPTGIHVGAFMAVGAFGQYLYVHPAERVVAVILSAWQSAEEQEAGLETFALLRAAVLALRAPS